MRAYTHVGSYAVRVLGRHLPVLIPDSRNCQWNAVRSNGHVLRHGPLLQLPACARLSVPSVLGSSGASLMSTLLAHCGLGLQRRASALNHAPNGDFCRSLAHTTACKCGTPVPW